MEVLSTAKWKYAMYVDPNAVPVGFNQSWEYHVSTKLRHKRYKNDNVNTRLLFCPEDCEDSDEPTSGMRAIEQGTCYGPILSGCIWGLKGKKNPQDYHPGEPAKRRGYDIAKKWYEKRLEEEPEIGAERMVENSLTKLRTGPFYDHIFFTDVHWSYLPPPTCGHENVA